MNFLTVNDMKEISPYESVQIDKLLEVIKSLVDDYSNYFYTKDPAQRLLDLKAEIDNIFDKIIND